MCGYLDALPEAQEIDVVFCENDNEAFGAIEALDQRGYRCGEDVDVICFDATRKALELCFCYNRRSKCGWVSFWAD